MYVGHDLNPAIFSSGQMLQVQEADQELQRHHRAALPMVPPHGERDRLRDSSLIAAAAARRVGSACT